MAFSSSAGSAHWSHPVPVSITCYVPLLYLLIVTIPTALITVTNLPQAFGYQKEVLNLRSGLLLSLVMLSRVASRTKAKPSGSPVSLPIPPQLQNPAPMPVSSFLGCPEPLSWTAPILLVLPSHSARKGYQDILHLAQAEHLEATPPSFFSCLFHPIHQKILITVALK